MDVGEGFPGFSAGKIALQGHEFASTLKGHTMVDVAIIHVAVDAVSGSSNPAGDGGRIKADLVCKSLE